MAFVITGSVINGLFGADASKSAANTQADAARYASDQQMTMFDKSSAMQKPWLDAGQNALGKLTQQLQGSEWNQPYSAQQMQNDPGYQFRLSEGNKALSRHLTAGGRMFSGDALKQMDGYNQGMASQEYGNAFNRFQTDRQARINPLLSMSGLGQGVANQVGQQGMQMAGQVGQNAMAGADAQAAGTMGRYNAGTSAMNSIYGLLQGYGSRSGGPAPIGVSTPSTVNSGWTSGYDL